MTTPTWRYVKHGRDPVNGGPSWIFQGPGGLTVAIPWDHRRIRGLSDAEVYLNDFLRLLDDRSRSESFTPTFTQPTITWHPSEGPAVTTDQADRRPKVL